MVASTANIGSDRNDAPQVFQNVTVNGVLTANGQYVQNGPTTQTGNETVNGNSTVNGNVILGTAGNGLQVKEGTNATMGTVTLNGQTEVTVATTAVTTNSRIFLTINTPNSTIGNIGVPFVSTKTNGTSFGVKSTNASDTTSVCAWLIVNPAP